MPIAVDERRSASATRLGRRPRGVARRGRRREPAGTASSRSAATAAGRRASASPAAATAGRRRVAACAACSTRCAARGLRKVGSRCSSRTSRRPASTEAGFGTARGRGVDVEPLAFQEHKVRRVPLGMRTARIRRERRDASRGSAPTRRSRTSTDVEGARDRPRRRALPAHRRADLAAPGRGRRRRRGPRAARGAPAGRPLAWMTGRRSIVRPR